MTRYNQYFVFQSNEDAEKIAVMARKRDGAEVEVVESTMYFPDKFTFEHINYHYRMKSFGDKKPLIKDVFDEQVTQVIKNKIKV